MKTNRRILVLGTGNFGTCLAQHLSNRGHKVSIWGRSSEITKSINEKNINPNYLSNYKLNSQLLAINSFREIEFNRIDAIIIAIPSQFIREVLQSIKNHLSAATLLISATKGIENGSLSFPSDIIASEFGEHWRQNTVTLSGPSFAVEVLQGYPTCVSLASTNHEASIKAQTLFHTPKFRCYTSTDPRGLELAGALKNIIAIASGASSGLGYETNSQAALLTRGLAEITRLGVGLGANPLTFTGLGGVGDLFLTGTSSKSRNFQVGYRLAKGDRLEDIISSMGSVAEGVSTSKSAYQLAQRHGIETPIINEVYQVLHNSKSIIEAVNALLTRDAKPELTLPDSAINSPGPA